MSGLMSEAPSAPPSDRPVDDSIPVVPLRHPVRNAIAILLVILTAAAAWNALDGA